VVVIFKLGYFVLMADKTIYIIHSGVN